MSGLSSLLLDIKTVIASCDPEVWYILTRYDSAFHEYAITPYAIARFIELFTVKTIFADYTEHRLFGRLNRGNDLPALIYDSGSQYWYLNNEQHRHNDLPAIICANGSRYWCQHGKYHRDNDLPAIVYADGAQNWFQHGLLHRYISPAIMYANGRCEWYTHGVRKR